MYSENTGQHLDRVMEININNEGQIEIMRLQMWPEEGHSITYTVHFDQ